MSNRNAEISLFFKNIPESQVRDPGPDLNRVLDFRQSIVDEKRILFQMFDNLREVERLVNTVYCKFREQSRSRDLSTTTS